jgi:transposase
MSNEDAWLKLRPPAPAYSVPHFMWTTHKEVFRMPEAPIGGNGIMDVERWTGKRKAEAVVDILKGRLTLVDFCRANDLKQSEVEKWMGEFLKAGQRALTGGAKAKLTEQEQQLKELQQVIGEQALQIRVLKKSIEVQERDETESS